MSDPIEKLTNCPQCGGILNEAGRCEFCGSKVYDFLTIDLPEFPFKYPSAKTYIRVKCGSKIMLAPVVVDTIEKTYGTETETCCETPGYPLTYFTGYNITMPTIDVRYKVTGNYIEVDE